MEGIKHSQQEACENLPLHLAASPFDYPIKQTQQNGRAAELCEDIKRNHHFWSHRKNFDELEDALSKSDFQARILVKEMVWLLSSFFC
jgi:hypothetical protein